MMEARFTIDACSDFLRREKASRENPDDTVEVGLADGLPVVIREMAEIAADVEAGIVDKRIEPFVAAFDFREKCGDLLRVSGRRGRAPCSCRRRHSVHLLLLRQRRG